MTVIDRLRSTLDCVSQCSRPVLCLAAVASLAAFGCNVDFKNPSQDETYRCLKQADCLDGFICRQRGAKDNLDKCNGPCDVCVARCESNSDCDKKGFVCSDKTNYCVKGCVDGDGDGWGSTERTRFCGACQNPGEYDCDNCSQQVACARDCDDSNPNVHPGPAHRFELCDGVDNNCDGKLAAGPKQVGGKTLPDQPIPCGGEKSSCGNQSSNQDGATVFCSRDKVKGPNDSKAIRQCVIQGDFAVCGDGNECRVRFCNSEGEWEKVPQVCRMNCPGG